MKHAVIMTVHNNPEVTRSLLRILDDERFTFFILVDRKSHYKNKDFLPPKYEGNVKFLDRMSINWGVYTD